MKIVADENIPFVQELFGFFGEVKTLPGRQMSSVDMQDAEILLVRSVTKVNEGLLANSDVKFVGTCTIGTDHLDTDYLLSKDIHFSSAPGCNAHGVVQYDLASLAHCGRLNSKNKIGIVGCGNVGGRLYRSLKALGFDCVVYDPFLSQDEVEDLCGWEALFDCDILCLHAPLTKSGPYPSYHMFNAQELSKLKNNCLLLNAGRGAVIDNQALLNTLQKRKDLDVVLDVWENEPDINIELMKMVKIASPHIAGYSYEGRTNGSLMIFKALAEFLGVDKAKALQKYNEVKQAAYGEPISIAGKYFDEIILNTYRPDADHKDLMNVMDELPSAFDRLRKNYPKRREFSHYRIAKGVEPSLKNALVAAGFRDEDK